ncbi:Hypothetical protein NocV09_00702850 [Nannochloropsis oceanica]
MGLCPLQATELQFLSPCSPSLASPHTRQAHLTTKCVLLTVGIIASLAWAVGLAAVLLPEWTVEDANVDSTLNAHIGLFETIYHVGEVRESSTLRFCNGLGPIYSTEKCVMWRVAQISALVGLGMGYTGLLFLYSAVGKSWIRPRRMPEVVAWVWTFFLLAGVCALASATAWKFLVLAFMRDHGKLGDGYSVKMGVSMLLMAGVGVIFLTLPFWRIVTQYWLVGSGSIAGFYRGRKSSLPSSSEASAVAETAGNSSSSSSRSNSSCGSSSGGGNKSRVQRPPHRHSFNKEGISRWRKRAADILQLPRVDSMKEKEGGLEEGEEGRDADEEEGEGSMRNQKERIELAKPPIAIGCQSTELK